MSVCSEGLRSLPNKQFIFLPIQSPHNGQEIRRYGNTCLSRRSICSLPEDVFRMRDCLSRELVTHTAMAVSVPGLSLSSLN